MSDDSQNLFDRLGGASEVAEIVQELYKRVLNDPELAGFFADTDMQRLRSMQFQFMAAAFDGPVGYSGTELTRIHANRGITSRHFSAFCQHFIHVLEARDVADRDVDDAVARLAMYKDNITGEANAGE